ncbi:MAG: hypothetical protein QOI95_68 [Acidimicrobiaceae bacterium]|jgi:hypothetical protein
MEEASLTTVEVEDLAGQVLASGSSHPAIERLQQAHQDHDEVERKITSYDRLHHRHNRH